ncbi:hypothetical protein JOD54_003244 [Actinokineospora baliensis]|uniref:hypothetical protein n=1 Tax=Actinokineospora baliensis TaxID=547056 RepID=UPI00195717D9|nr:hypothetical protein [Actinokineospora baliensis]MBM7773040.1 hypothetical protein [Actinokineospora baliensis]
MRGSKGTVARYYLPWPTPVQAAHYTDPSTLPAISQWVTALRQQGKVAPEVTFGIDTTDHPPTGVLTDQTGAHPLRLSGFLVFGRQGLHVLDAHTFWLHYRDVSRG